MLRVMESVIEQIDAEHARFVIRDVRLDCGHPVRAVDVHPGGSSWEDSLTVTTLCSEGCKATRYCMAIATAEAPGGH